MTRQHDLEPCDRPFLERFGQQRVVRVRQRPSREVPGLVPTEVCFVEQNPHQLGDGHRRMRIVELDGDFLGERAPVGVVRRKRRTRSASEQATRKYSCTKRSPCPMLVESSGYNTRVSDSASSVSASAPTKSPLLNS